MLDLINMIKNGPPKRSESSNPARQGTRRPWTDAELDTLKTMAGCHTTAVIASALGRSARAVEQRAHQLGISLSMRDFDPAMIVMARALCIAGFTPMQIIDTFEIGTEKGRRIMRALEDRK